MFHTQSDLQTHTAMANSAFQQEGDWAYVHGCVVDYGFGCVCEQSRTVIMTAVDHSSVLPELKTSLETFPFAPQEVCSVLKESGH